MLDYVDLKNKLQLGLITTTAFHQGLGKLKSGSDANNLILDINILRYSLTGDSSNDDIQNNMVVLKSIFDRIDSSSLPENTKQLYSLWNAMNESVIIGNIFSRNITLTRTHEVAGNDLSPAVKKKQILAYLGAEKTFAERIEKIYAAARASNNVFVCATALQLSATHLVQRIINIIALDLDTRGLEEIIRNRAGQALESYNLFVQLDLIKDAHTSLSLNIELLDAAKHLFDSNVDGDLTTLTKTIATIEREMMLPPNFRVIQSTIEDKVEQKRLRKTQPPMASLKDQTDAQLDTFARIMMESYSLRDDTYMNVMNALKAYRLFYKRCHNPNIRPEESPHDQTYEKPIVFNLKNTITKIVSLPSSDMGYLLTSWGY